MSNKRPYRSEKRLSQAKQTRLRILQSAKDFFETRGFDLVSIEEIASSAGVSSQLIYALFKSKLGILREIVDQALPPQQFQALVEASKQALPERRLLFSAKIARKIYDAEKEQMHLFKGASVLSPEFRVLEEERETRRHKRLEDTIESLHREKALKKSLSKRCALDLLWAFTGRDLYRMLVIDQGWSSHRYEQWLGKHLAETLLY